MVGNMEGLLDLVPDSVVEKAVERKQQMSRYAKIEKADTVTFAEVALMSAQLDFFVGSYALRALVFSRPAECQLLSSMELAPGEFIQRCEVKTTTGEHMILAFRLCLEERYQPSYRGFTTGKCWVLRTIKGEPAAEEGMCPTEPDPRWGPESIVCGQLEALREGDVERALSFVAFPVEDDASSSSRPSMVHRIPAYAPLMYHHGYNVAATAQVSADASVIFVGVHGQRSVEGGTDPAQYMLPYMWFLSLHQGTTWMIDTVQHVSGA
ncbi:g7150 [Coccomyxa elongata]